MFTFVENPEFTHDVTVKMPVDGGYREETFKARFKVLSTKEMDTHMLSASFSVGNAAFLKAVIVSFEEIVDDAKKPLPYNDGLRDQVLGNPPAQMALMQTYLKAVSQVKQGN